MKKILFLQSQKREYRKNQPLSRIEFIGFVADQFKKLARKNLRIPVTLYHL